MGKAAIRTVRPRQMVEAKVVGVPIRYKSAPGTPDSHSMDPNLSEQARLIATGLERREDGKTLRAALRAYFDVFDSDQSSSAVRDECVRLATQSLVIALRAGTGLRPSPVDV